MAAIEDRYYSKEEYFSLVAESDLKIEYHKGQIYAMAGGTSNHNIISGNILTGLNNALVNSLKIDLAVSMLYHKIKGLKEEQFI
ncbi:MAG: Uma2 family endonuclease [Saprospiraceae bacterium]